SAYLTTISLTVLQAACPYCLTSFTLMIATLALVTFKRPDLRLFPLGSLAKIAVPVGVVFILLLHLNYVGVLGEAPAAEDPEARALASYLSQHNVKMYGAYWCPHCQEQKEMFGASASRVPYVECSPNGQGRPQATECRDAKIQMYPTWIINGQRI